MTQGLLWRLSGVEEVHNWASHLEHLQSIEFDADRAPESPTSFDSFEKDVSLRSRPRWNMREGATQLGRTSRRKFKLRTSPHTSHTDTPRIHIPRGLRMARLPIKRLGRRRRGSSVVEMLSKVERTLPPLPVSTRLAPPKGHYSRNCSKPKRDTSED